MDPWWHRLVLALWPEGGQAHARRSAYAAACELRAQNAARSAATAQLAAQLAGGGLPAQRAPAGAVVR